MQVNLWHQKLFHFHVLLKLESVERKGKNYKNVNISIKTEKSTYWKPALSVNLKRIIKNVFTKKFAVCETNLHKLCAWFRPYV